MPKGRMARILYCHWLKFCGETIFQKPEFRLIQTQAHKINADFGASKMPDDRRSDCRIDFIWRGDLFSGCYGYVDWRSKSLPEQFFDIAFSAKKQAGIEVCQADSHGHGEAYSHAETASRNREVMLSNEIEPVANFVPSEGAR